MRRLLEVLVLITMPIWVPAFLFLLAVFASFAFTIGVFFDLTDRVVSTDKTDRS